jgi:KaiC/GvpD/RAD55 family RecA-like ATPase
LTGIVTAKFDLGELQHLAPRQSFLPYLSACVVLLQNRLQGPTLHRSLRVAKYRGTSHSANEHSMVIGERGWKFPATIHASSIIRSPASG